jgi:2,3-diketo-5-methylthio-1-phosphopentane phosphatase
MLFLVDFDGTIAPTDTVDALLERYADPEWLRIEERWVRGEISSRQCMAAQIALVRAGRAELDEFFNSIRIDPAFVEFIAMVKPFAEVVVVSDGLDVSSRHALRGLGVPVFANHLQFRQPGLELSFPYSDAACKVGSGVCKCAVARKANAGRGLTTVLIGDGRSDFCVARCVDYVFAKGTLRSFCEAENIIHSPFETFADVLPVVRGWAAHEREEDACPLVPG